MSANAKSKSLFGFLSQKHKMQLSPVIITPQRQVMMVIALRNLHEAKHKFIETYVHFASSQGLSDIALPGGLML